MLAQSIESLKKSNAEVERDVERVQKRNSILEEVGDGSLHCFSLEDVRPSQTVPGQRLTP